MQTATVARLVAASRGGRATSRRLVDAATYVLMTLIGLVAIFPLFWALSTV